MKQKHINSLTLLGVSLGGFSAVISNALTGWSLWVMSIATLLLAFSSFIEFFWGE